MQALALVAQFSNVLHLLVYFYIFMPVFIAFYMYFADAPPDESLDKRDCCGFNVSNFYSVAVQIKIYYDSGMIAVEHCEAK